MKILLNSNERVFQIVTSTGKQVFCNLKHITSVLAELQAVEGYYKIYHFFNNKPKKASKKMLAEMVERAKIEVNNKVFTITIEAKEWFDNINGNSYHAGTVVINMGMKSQQAFTFGLTYGYDSQYKVTAIKTLVNARLLPNLTSSQLYDYLSDNNIEVRASILRNCKKSELKQYNK